MKSDVVRPLGVSIVAPVFNEASVLPQFLERTLAAAHELDREWELILIDDGSSDSSREMIEAAALEHPGRVVGVILNRNYGQHAAILAGFAQSRGDVVVTIDADLQNPPEEIQHLLAQTDAGHDVIGSIRRDRQDTFFRKLASRTINGIMRRFGGVSITDLGCMLRAYERPIVDAMLACPDRSTFIPVLALSFARSSIEIEIEHAERESGESKYGLLKLINLQFDLVTSTTTFPLRLLSLVGLVISAAGLGFGLLLLAMRLFLGSEWAAQGVFTLFAILFLFVGAQFVGMGLLGEYLGRVYSEVRGRPRYVVAEVLDRAGAAPIVPHGAGASGASDPQPSKPASRTETE